MTSTDPYIPAPAVTTSVSPSTAAVTTAPLRTLWGLEPQQMHGRFWAAHGVQVVHQGERSQIVKHAELFLLSDPRTLCLFSLAPLMDTLNWVKPSVLFVRLHDTRERGYREQVITDEQGQFVRFQRLYDVFEDYRLARVALTPDRDIAQLWQSAADPLTGWRRLRRYIPRIDRTTRSIEGHVYHRSSDSEMAYFLRDLLETWKRPDSTVVRISRHQANVWRDSTARIDNSARFIGPVWIGAGRHVEAGQSVIGPAWLWDDPAARPQTQDIHWLEIEPQELPKAAPLPRASTLLDRASKRLFDLCFASIAFLLTVWLYPFIMLAIWLEDGRPFFFAHRRETRGGREFPCIKFRSMRKDAEAIKTQLQTVNQADGPQFFMEHDPRLTKVGAVLRKYHLDELPQFINVLMGHMSVVGPRPSPFKENQYCPPWREARLSVRPGITGLWQVKRTRRAGTDFQEWIKYDLEYVETRNGWLDIKIIFATAYQIIRKAAHS